MLRSFLTLATLLILLMVPAPQAAGAAADSNKKPAATPEAALETAPVQMDGQTLFRVRGASSYPAEDRAAAIENRIEKAAQSRLPSGTLRIEEQDDGSLIMAGDQLLMMVSDYDANLEHLNRQNLAQLHLARIRQAIDDYRVGRSSENILRSALLSAGATVMVTLLILVLIPLWRAIDRWLRARMKERIETAGIQGLDIVRTEQLWKGLHALLYYIRVAIVILLLFVYLHVVLSLFPWTHGAASRLFGMDSDAVASMGKAVLNWIPDLVVLVILYYLFRFLLRLLHHLFDALGKKTISIAGFDPEWARPTYKMVRFALLAFAVVVAYPYLPGSESAAFKGISVFIGVVFSLGSSAAVSNIIAGYLIFYRRVFRVGDRVKVGEVVGDVLAIRLQVTHLLSIKNEEITIPNSQILSGTVMNYSSMAAQQGLILHTEVGIGYEVPWRQVEAMLLQAAERTPGLLREPLPFVLIKRLGDFSVFYEINVYSGKPQESPETYHHLHRQILDVFNEYGVQIMTPAYVLDPAQPKVVARDQWYAPPASAANDLPQPPHNAPAASHQGAARARGGGGNDGG
jgi:small-conductance mechanosensitive channel